jgi:hypothetical protein
MCPIKTDAIAWIASWRSSLDDGMSGGMGVNAGKLGAYPPMIPAHGRYSLGFVDRQPRRRIGIAFRIILQHVSQENGRIDYLPAAALVGKSTHRAAIFPLSRSERRH